LALPFVRSLAQGTFTGRVTDSQNGQELPFANIQLHRLPDSLFLHGLFADEQGKFRIDSLAHGQYLVTLSYMGYREESFPVKLEKKQIDLGFGLTPVQYLLNEVEIQAAKNTLENNLEKTTVHIAKNETLAGGNASDAIRSLPSVDLDIDGKIRYRGSDRVILLINGAQSDLVTTLDQIPAEQIEKIEIINNPSVKYDSEGMSGIINIVLRKAAKNQKTTQFMVKGGLPRTLGASMGLSTDLSGIRLFINGSVSHQTKFQTKDHIRKNYEDPDGIDYHQFDRQDAVQNNALLNGQFHFPLGKRQKIQLNLLGSTKFDPADRYIDYTSMDRNGTVLTESRKELDIDLLNYHFDGRINYRVDLRNKAWLQLEGQYADFNQWHTMNNTYYPVRQESQQDLQNTYSLQDNQDLGFKLDHNLPLNRYWTIEAGGQVQVRNLRNDFRLENWDEETGIWLEIPELGNTFAFLQSIEAGYLNGRFQNDKLSFQGGLRTEWTQTSQNDSDDSRYFDLFPALNVKWAMLPTAELFGAYNRRINRPTLLMLNPYTNEYADLLNRHTGNPLLQPEYVHSAELGGRIIRNNWSATGSVYYRQIDQAISRVKSAVNDSALLVTFLNLDGAEMLGSEFFIQLNILSFWQLNGGLNLFRTRLEGNWENNLIQRKQTGWNINLTNNFRIAGNYSLQLVAYYRSKLPDVMGTYIERYYLDLSLSRPVFQDKGRLIFRISDVFNTYRYGLDLDAIDENFFRYSQRNRRKNESQYFVLSLSYNVSQKQKTEKKESFYLEQFDK
jgi:outer membrane cobalamin receptor